MPLDGQTFVLPDLDFDERDASTRLGRLLILRDLTFTARDIDQREFCTCLWHDAINDPRLRAAGFVPKYSLLSNPNDPMPALLGATERRFFGLRFKHLRRIFGSGTLRSKRAEIDCLIAEERDAPATAKR